MVHTYKQKVVRIRHWLVGTIGIMILVGTTKIKPLGEPFLAYQMPTGTRNSIEWDAPLCLITVDVYFTKLFVYRFWFRNCWFDCHLLSKFRLLIVRQFACWPKENSYQLKRTLDLGLILLPIIITWKVH